MHHRTSYLLVLSTLLGLPVLGCGGSDDSSNAGTAGSGGGSAGAGGSHTGGTSSGGTSGSGTGGNNTGGTSTGGSGGSGGSTPSTPAGFYTDVVKAPVGAWVTAYGTGFGASGDVTLGGTAQTVFSYSDTKVVFVISGGGGALEVAGKPLGNVEVISGQVIEVTPQTIEGEVANWQPGDFFYLHGGAYSGVIRSDQWNFESQFDVTGAGTAAQPIAIIGFPGEEAVLQSNADNGTRPTFSLAVFDTGAAGASHFVIANLNMVTPECCVDGGGNTADSNDPESGAVDVRVVGNRCELTDETENTMTGMMALQGDDWHILGNVFVNPPNREIINNNHGVYVQCGADNVEVGYNAFSNLRMGHVVQVHQDGEPMDYQNVWIHDNSFQANDDMDCRGISVGNVASSSTLTLERNWMENMGQDFSAFAVYGGHVIIKDNSTFGVRAPIIDLNGQSLGNGSLDREVIATGNRFEPTNGWEAVLAENGASMNEITLSGNSYCGVSAPSEETGSQPCSP